MRARRWCGLIAAALLVGPTRLGAQLPRHDSTVVTVAGSGPTTFVLLSGLVGGVAGFRRLQAALVERGQRVFVIDPYRLAVDSTEVTFVALARYVDALLAEYGVDSAQVVGHAHGAGVALRLAANSPRVSGLFFLDVGALEENRTKVFSSSLRLVPLIARLPGGRGFVRRRYVRGLRQNAAREEWLDAATERAYTEPFLDNLSRVVAMAGRLANAREPESRLTTVSRVRVPVTVLLGAVPHPAGPDSAELDVLAPLGGLLRIERLAGVSHFPHEEATADVATRLLAPRNESRQNGHPER
jgi:pimeloyl-ACP methyl ester carboxylesterase